MAGELRCFEGHIWRYDGIGGNDPAGETDMGVCGKCLGRGCENRVDERDYVSLLTDVSQMLDVVKVEWSEDKSWSEWDQEVRDRITKHLRWLTTKPATSGIYDPDYIAF